MIVFDIETGPDERVWSDPEFCAGVRDGISAPANYKDPLKIAAYIDERYDDAKASAALSWVHGKIRAIGWTVDGQIQAFASDDEGYVVRSFATILRDLPDRTLVGGFNIREFDVPFLSMRAAVHDISLPAWWPQRRPWGNGIIDPVDLFGRNGRLKDYLAAMDLPPKLGDGADAPNLEIPELIEYVKRDVECEAALIERLRHYFPGLRAASN
jgi:hypothetical protein